MKKGRKMKTELALELEPELRLLRQRITSLECQVMKLIKDKEELKNEIKNKKSM